MASNYQAEYAKLNSQQQQAVDTIEGPVMVLAGPGTGKTQLLSLRVANILRQTDTSASNILCLTFTNFAAANMRSRLNELIGPSAHRVIVRTFHSFAAEIMNQYPDYFWNGARLSTAPDAIQLELVNDILGSLPLDNPLASRFGGSLTAVKEVQKQISLAKDAGLTPAKLAAMINYNSKYLDIVEPALADILSAPLSVKRLDGIRKAVMSLPDDDIDESIKPLKSLSAVIKSSLEAALSADAGSGKTTKTGQWKKRWIQTIAGQKGMFDERRRNAWWLAVADVYEDYRDALHARGYYDYSDMIVEVISQLQQKSDLLAGVQERFLYVLIDEFQDTNAAQLQLAHLVATHFSNGDQPNLMVVGDDDQSIYAFNGAELSNMLNFQETYPTVKTIVLKNNYRSTQAVLDLSRAIIEQADERLVHRRPELDKLLTAVASVEPGEIQHLHYPTRDHELLAMADKIADDWDNRSTTTTAVLARNHESLRRVSVILNDRSIPISYEQQNDILQSEIVELIYLIMKTVQAISSGAKTEVNQNLAQLLRYPAWGVTPHDLWKLAVDNHSRPDWLNSLLEQGDESLQSLANWLLWLGQQHVPLPMMLEYLIGLRAGEHLTSPVREYYLNRELDSDYMLALSGIRLLTDLSNEFAESETATLDDLVRFIDLNKGLDRAVTDQSWFVSGERTVQLMTVHKAKGLEFDKVYVLDVVEDNWQPRSVSRKPPANLPLQPYGEIFDDYVRLLYVAVTRAKQSVIISSYASNEQGNTVLASPLITNALAVTEIAGNEVAPNHAVIESALIWPRLNTSDEKILLASRLEDFYLTTTGLTQFLNVAESGPQVFLENQLLRLPEPSSTALSYGVAIHAALQTAQQLVNDGLSVLPAILEKYESELLKRHMTEEDFTRFLNLGQQMLTKLFTDKNFVIPKGGLAEITLNDIYIGEARIGGKLDHILVTDNNHLLISDYKTGKPLTSLTTKDQTKIVKAWQYRTQLAFYTLLASSSSRFADSKHIESQVIYVEAETTREMYLGFVADQAAIERIESLVVAVWKHVKEMNLPDISKYSPDMNGITAFEDDLISGAI